MNSLFADYKKEREGKLLLETAEGFAIYQIEKPQCYIEDIYVVPNHRRSGVATEIAQMVEQKAKEAECTLLLGSVVPSTTGSTESLQALLSYGFKLQSSLENFIWFTKEIK